MAKYKSGEEARVGDIVKCNFDGLDGISIGAVCCVSECCGQNVKLTSTWGLLYGSCYFDFIRRNGQSAPSPEPEQPAVNNEQSPPLVVWPETSPPLTFKNLSQGELFVFDEGVHDQSVKRKTVDGFCIVFDSPSGNFVYTGMVHQVENERRSVRRLKQTVAPQFTVI